jgi:hypothetical protein
LMGGLGFFFYPFDILCFLLWWVMDSALLPSLCCCCVSLFVFFSSTALAFAFALRGEKMKNIGVYCRRGRKEARKCVGRVVGKTVVGRQ